MNYITGSSGFLGSCLTMRIVASHLGGEVGPGETVFWLGAYGNRRGQDDTKEAVSANTLKPLLCALDGNRIVYISTSSVGLKEQTAYSRSKRAAEEALLALGGHCIIRPFSITGVGEQKEHLIPTLIRSCLYGEEMPFVPWPEHDYIDVNDVADAIVELAPQDGVFEVGSGIGWTNQQVLELVEQATGKKANVRVTESLRPYDTKSWKTSVGRARKPLAEIIEDMVRAARS